MKIVQCITLSELGGAQKIVGYLSSDFLHDHEVIIATSPEGELINEVQECGRKVYRLLNIKREISPLNDIKTFIELIKILRTEKPDIVHCHSWKAGILGRIAAYFCGVNKIYFTVHGWSILSKANVFTKKAFIIIEWALSLVTTKLVCVCKSDEKAGIDFKIATENKFVSIYNGVKDLKHLDIVHTDVRKEHKIPEDAILIGTVARLASQKRCIESAEIFSKISSLYKNVYFIYIGDGLLLNPMREKIRSLDLENKFILAGSRNNVPSYLKSMDIFLLLSNYEGLPVSILEAMSMELPIIASNVGGVGELIEEGVNGFLVSNEEYEIIQKLSLLIENKELRKGLGIQSRERFEKYFTVEKMIEGYRKLYEG